MTKSLRRAPLARLPLAVLALAAVAVSACDSDSSSPFPSRGPVVSVDVQTLPTSAPKLLVVEPITGGGPETRRLLAVPQDAAGNWVDAPVTWSSSNAAVATVSAEGIVTAVSQGDATITATAGGQTGTLEFGVRQLPQVASVNIGGPGPTVRGLAGQTVQLTATAVEIGGIAIPGIDFTWSSASPQVATVSQTGLVTFHDEVGTSVITATAVADDVSGTRTVNRRPQLMQGTTVQGPMVADDMFEYLIVVPAGMSQFTVETSGGTGDADIYAYAPANLHAGGTGGFAAASFNDGNVESITISNPAAGTWRLLVHAWPGGGAVSGLNVRLIHP